MILPELPNLLSNLSDIDPDDWRRQLNWVPQQGYLFNESITENIRLGDTTAVHTEVELAAKKASASLFINEFAQGYDTLLGENGARLSGGQAQRIALYLANDSN